MISSFLVVTISLIVTVLKLLLPLFIVFFLVSLLISAFSPIASIGRNNEALLTLNRRLANGEISHEEYHHIKSLIS